MSAERTRRGVTSASPAGTPASPMPPAGPPATPPIRTPQSDLFATQAALARALGLDAPPEPEADLRLNLGATSFSMLEAVVILEEALGTPSDFGKVAQARTVRDLSRCW